MRDALGAVMLAVFLGVALALVFGESPKAGPPPHDPMLPEPPLTGRMKMYALENASLELDVTSAQPQP